MSPRGVYDSVEARRIAAREAALDIIEAAADGHGKCCTRCRRGTKAHTSQPDCGYNYRCPNPKCDHPKGPRR